MGNKKNVVFLKNIILLVIFLAGMNFMLLGSYLVILAFVMLLVMSKGKIYSNNGVISLFLLAFSYFFFDLISNGNMNLRICAAPCSFLVAYNLGIRSKQYAPKQIQINIAIAMAFHSIASFFYSLNIGGIGGFASGRSYDAWSGQLSSATGIASYYFFLAAAIPIMVLRPKWYHIAIFAVSLLHDVLIGGRTFIVLSVVSLVLTLLLRAFNREGGAKSALKYIIIITAISFIVFIMYQNNFFNIRTIFEDSYMFRRFFQENNYEGISSTPRWERKIIYIQNFLNYPFGGNHLRNELKIGFAHDIWLDTFDRSGLLAFGFMFFYTILSVFHFFRFARKTENDCQTKILFYVFPVVMMAAFFVEPIMDGAPMVFFMYCFMDGLICSKLSEMRNIQ